MTRLELEKLYRTYFYDIRRFRPFPTKLNYANILDFVEWLQGMAYFLMPDLRTYGRHLSTCNVNKQELWDEAQAALNQCEMDEGTSCAIAEIAVKRTKCDCGFESALSAAPSAAQPEKEAK